MYTSFGLPAFQKKRRTLHVCVVVSIVKKMIIWLEKGEKEV